MAAEPSITEIALDVHPDQATLVPERREEVTTEGGLDVAGNRERVARCIDRLLEAGIEVSLFIDADRAQIDAAEQLGAHAVELHTGRYADTTNPADREAELTQLIDAGHWARERGLLLHMGHGLTYRNVVPVARIPGVSELNIGHSIVARAVMVGFERAVREMKELVAG
jgi:pyridoxine 5-phosphate synthase